VFQEIHDDAPAIWLYEQRTMSAISRRFVTTPLRADAWYAGLADWRVDPALRIDRDRIGRGTPP
jgi:peptide/nickel transport system substrate-binding protein